MFLITAIICTYNSEKTIKRALESVFLQNGYKSKFELQVIVVDDCSVDDTMNILKRYPVEIHTHKVNSGGPNKGRNVALKEAKGDYIAFLDHDDEWLPDKLSSQISAIKEEKVITSGYDDVDIYTHKRRIIKNESDSGVIRYAKNDTFLAKLTRAKNAQKTYFGSIMIHKDLKHILFEEEYGMVDFDWVLKIFENQSSVEVAKALFVRYVDGLNLSLNERYRLNDYKISSEAICSYKPRYPQAYTLGLKRLNGSMGRYYYLIGKPAAARRYFMKANVSLINIMYIITSYVGRNFVIKRFKVFG